jgi:uncharacterized membrane protein YhaH (DUF805 family)
MRLYRAALHLYPSAFRREYGDAMADALRDQRRYGRLSPTHVAVDVLMTAPRMRLESLMSHRVGIIGASLAALVLLMVAGPIGLVVVVAATVFLIRRQHDADTDRWYVLLGAGALVLAATIAYAVANGEMETAVSWGAWMLTFTAGLVLTTAGVVLGGMRFAATRS